MCSECSVQRVAVSTSSLCLCSFSVICEVTSEPHLRQLSLVKYRRSESRTDHRNLHQRNVCPWTHVLLRTRSSKAFARNPVSFGAPDCRNYCAPWSFAPRHIRCHHDPRYACH